MSIQLVRRALEKRLAAMLPALATAYQNVAFQPQPGIPYQRSYLMPSDPDNSVAGSRMYFERGIFQVSLMYPAGTGPAAAEARAQAVRDQFKRGTSMTESGITVLVTDTPSIAQGIPDGDRFVVPVSIRFQAQVAT